MQQWPFRQVTVRSMGTDSNTVSWVLQEGVYLDVDCFKIYTRRRPGEDLTYLGKTSSFYYEDNVSVLTDIYSLLDGAAEGGAYVIKLVTTDGQEYDSKPSALPDSWTLRDIQVASKLCKREQRDYKANGIKFYILHRRHWGPKCTKCIDKVTEEVTNPSCSLCYGTAHIGGYYNPVSVNGRFYRKENTLGEDSGDIEENVLLRSCELFLITPYDVLVLPNLGRRCKILNIETVVGIKGSPVVYNIGAKVLNPGHIVYKFNMG